MSSTPFTLGAGLSSLSAVRCQPRVMTRSRALLLVLGAVMALLVAGCGSGGSSSPGQSAGTVATPTESSPLGDIPDNQVYVPYSPSDGTFTVKVPEGWARTDITGGVSFTDKLNTVTVQQLSGRPAPNQDSVLRSELADIANAESSVTLGTVDTRSLPVGDVIHATYTADSPPDPVTGRVTRDDVELYVFWRNGSEVLLTLSGPHGADDVDAWRTVSSSFTWN
jgi:hypothetical protein